MIRMVDGASGGGSAVAMAEAPMAVPAMTRYGLLHSYKMLDEVPVCSVAMGPSVGGGGEQSRFESSSFQSLTLFL